MYQQFRKLLVERLEKDAKNGVITDEYTTTDLAKALSDVAIPYTEERYGQTYNGHLVSFMPKEMEDVAIAIAQANNPEYANREIVEKLLMHYLQNRTSVIAGIASALKITNENENLFSMCGYTPMIRLAVRHTSIASLQEQVERLYVRHSISRAGLSDAINYYNHQVRRMKERLDQLSPIKDQKKGLEAVLSEQLATAFSYEDGYDAIINIGKQMPTALTARTWGWELEVADAKDVRVDIRGIDSSRDGSIKPSDYENCDCDCRDCTYHECNCDDCELYNDDPEHCSDRYCANADSIEFKSTNGIQRSTHAGLKTLITKLNDNGAYVNESCGIHIHVFGADLTPKQAGKMMAAYVLLKPLWNKAMLRQDMEYAYANKVNEIKGLLKNQCYFEKMREVNITWLRGDRGTVEFRQAEARLDYEFIIGWSFIVRSLVTAFKRNAEINDFFNIANYEELLAVFAKFNITVGNENPEDIVYGTNNDSVLVKRNQFMPARS